MTCKKLSFCVVIFLGISVVQGAIAAPITFEFSGYISQEYDDVSPWALTFPTGTAISGYYTFESTTPDSDPRDEFGQYFALTDFSLTIGDYSATFAGTYNEIQVINNGGFVGSEDAYIVAAGLTGPSVDGIPLSFASLSFYDGTATALSSDDLLLDAALLSPFGEGSLQLTFTDDSDPMNLVDYSIYGTITNVQTSVVPLPAAFWLFLSGLAVPLGSRLFSKGASPRT